MFLLGILNVISFENLMVIGVGGFLAALFGFFDDIVNLNALMKLFFQSILAGWVLVVYWVHL